MSDPYPAGISPKDSFVQPQNLAFSLGISPFAIDRFWLPPQPRISHSRVGARTCAVERGCTPTELNNVQLLWAGYRSQVTIGVSLALFVHFHLLFSSNPLGQWGKLVLLIAFGLAGAIALAYISSGVFPVRSEPWYPLLTVAKDTLLLGSMGTSVLALARAWRQGHGQQRRRVRRLIGSVLAICQGLRPSALEKSGLKSAINQLITQ